MPPRVSCLSDDSGEDVASSKARRLEVDEPFVKKDRGSVPRVQAPSDDECGELMLPMPVPPGRLRPFVEVFAGSQHLSDAFKAAGRQVFPMDVKISMDHDMHGEGGAELRLAQLRQMTRESGLKPSVNFAPPCTNSLAGWGGREALSNAGFGVTLADYAHYSSKKRLMMHRQHAGPERFIVEVAGNTG